MMPRPMLSRIVRRRSTRPAPCWSIRFSSSVRLLWKISFKRVYPKQLRLFIEQESSYGSLLVSITITRRRLFRLKKSCAGDKLQTAIEIGFSCNLLKNDMDIMILSADTVEG